MDPEETVDRTSIADACPKYPSRINDLPSSFGVTLADPCACPSLARRLSKHTQTGSVRHFSGTTVDEARSQQTARLSVIVHFVTVFVRQRDGCGSSGVTGLRGWRTPCHRPQNLNWVMPAEGKP
jgi:hypothetical protein